MKKFQQGVSKVMMLSAMSKKLSALDDENVSGFNRDSTVHELLMMETSNAKTDMNALNHLSNDLMDEAVDRKLGNCRESLYLSILIKEWICYRESAEGTNKPVMSSRSLIRLAHGHFELWSNMGVASGSTYHLERSMHLFEQVFQEHPNMRVPEDMFTYCKVLQYMGHLQRASEIIDGVIKLHSKARNMDEVQQANYLFFAGGIMKILGEHEKANEFFFEANELGPPRLFTKLEMMMIISRTIEEHHRNDDAEQDDAYRMVHAHLILEGLLEEDVGYDDWISRSETWLDLGDKCSLHDMYSLACDMYSLGIMKDMDAFKKPMLWFRFAKACKRCGRVADAQLAIEQALTYDPHNMQLSSTLLKWSTPTSTTLFEDEVRGALQPILLRVKTRSSKAASLFPRIQGAVKGLLLRHQMRIGIGRRRDITRRMSSKLAIVLRHGQRYLNDDGDGDDHRIEHLILAARSDWSGRISNLLVFDVKQDKAGKIALQTPFAPMKDSGKTRRLTLSMSCEKVRAGEMHFRSHTRKNHRKHVEEDEVKEKFYDAVELTFRFTDADTGSYFCRKVRLLCRELLASLGAGDSGVGDGAADGSTTTAEQQLSEGSSSDQQQPSSPPLRPESHTPLSAHTHFEASSSLLSVADHTDNRFRAVITETNVQYAELQREGFSWQSSYFLARVTNEGRVTRVTLMQAPFSRCFEFLLLREHIDRSHRLVKRYRYLLSLLLQLQATRQLLVGQEVVSSSATDAEDQNPLAAVAGSNLSFVEEEDGVLCRVRLFPDSLGCLVTAVIDPSSSTTSSNTCSSILGSGLEVLVSDREELNDGDTVSSLSADDTSVEHKLRIIQSSKSYLEICKRWFPDDEVMAEDVDAQVAVDQDKAEVGVAAADEVRAEKDHTEKDIVDNGRGVTVTEIEEAPIVTEIEEAPIVTEIEEAPIVIEIKDEPIVTEIEEAPIVIQIKDEPIVTEIEEAPIVTEIKDEPIVTEIEETPIVTEIKEAPIVTEIKEAPIVTEIEEAPIVTEIKDEPIVTEIEEAPIVTEIEEAPIVTEIKEAPNVTEIEEAPIVTEIEEEPIVTEIEEAPIVTVFKEAPIVTEIEEAPIVEEASIVTEINEAPIVTEIEAESIVTEDQISTPSVVVGDNADSAGVYEGGTAEDPSSPLQVGELLEVSVDDDKVVHRTSADDDKEAQRRAMELKSDLDDRRRKVRAAAKVPFGAGSSALGGLDVNMGPLSVPVVTEYKVVKIQRSAPSNDDNGAGDLSVSSKRDSLVSFSRVYPLGGVRDETPADDTHANGGGSSSSLPSSSLHSSHNEDPLDWQQQHDEDSVGAKSSISWLTDVSSYQQRPVRRHANLQQESLIPHIKLSSMTLPVGIPLSSIYPTKVSGLEPAVKLKRSLLEWDKLDNRTKLDRTKYMGFGSTHAGSPLVVTSTIDPSELQPFRHHLQTAMRSKSSDVISSVLEDDGSVSIISKSQRPHSIDEVRGRGGSDQEVMSSTGNTPLFKTVQLRQIQHLLPAPDTASICTAGSQSRVGSRRIKNSNLLPLPLNEDSGVAVVSSSSNEPIITINDPLKLPNSRRDEVNQRVFKKSMEEMKYKGYVKHRPLAHASHWTRQLTTFLSAVPSLEYLQKSLTQLHKASTVPLTPEEAICALSDTGGSVGEVVAKLTELKFYKELQLVCRVMHVQGLVLQYVRGGDRLFHPVRTAATRASSKAGSRTGRRSVTVGHTTTTTDYSGAKTVTFSDHFDASTADGDHEHDPQDIIISRDPNSSSSSKRQFFFNGEDDESSGTYLSQLSNDGHSVGELHPTPGVKSLLSLQREQGSRDLHSTSKTVMAKAILLPITFELVSRPNTSVEHSSSSHEHHEHQEAHSHTASGSVIEDLSQSVRRAQSSSIGGHSHDHSLHPCGLDHKIQSMLEDYHVGNQSIAVTVMTRSAALIAQQQEVLRGSNKCYIRDPIERKITTQSTSRLHKHKSGTAKGLTI